jgi:Kef-type K+ transport system membrane component KefB
MDHASEHLSILLILGIGVFGGIMGAWLFQKLRIPQVIGYIVIGLLVGQSGLGIIGPVEIPTLRPFSFLALAFIGFLVGGELEAKIFKQYGRQFMGIMFGESLGAFFLVGLVSGLILFLWTGDPRIAVAGGIVFGAISSATDPASTIDVLWEYRAKGMLTTGLIAVVALDDALALTLYALGTSAANMLVGEGGGWQEVVRTLGIELVGSTLLGIACGFGLSTLLRHSQNQERSLTLLTGALLLIAGVCYTLHLDVILCAMAAGATLINHAPRRSKPLMKTLREFAGPIYVMFFVLVGARLQINAQPTWIWILVGCYVIARSVGKYVGTWIGASANKSSPVLKKYIGFGLFAQGGVAVGLSMMAGQHLSGVEIMPGLDLGTVVISTVTATTLIVQLLGPAGVKFAITKTDEIGRNVTEEDVIKGLRVQDVMNDKPVTISEAELLSQVFEKVSTYDQLAYPVVNPAGQCTGVISLNSLKTLFIEQDIWSWMIAGDVMVPFVEIVKSETPLGEALSHMQQMEAEESIVRDPDSQQPIGIFETRTARRKVAKKLLETIDPGSKVA